MRILVGVVVGGSGLIVLVLWWLGTRLNAHQHDHGEVSQAWRDEHGRDQGKGGS
jgi:hypothetical protein